MNTMINEICKMIQSKSMMQKAIHKDTDIFRELGFDSFQFIELTVELEKAFQVSVPHLLLLPDNFATPEKIEQTLRPLISTVGMAES